MRLEVVYYVSGVQQERGGSTSCCSRSQELCSFSYEELETVRAAQELIGAPTIGGGVPDQGVVVEGVKEDI